jgi:hypothetical protein
MILLSFLLAARRVQWGAYLGIYKFGSLREDSRLATIMTSLRTFTGRITNEHKNVTIVPSTMIVGR